MKIATVVAGISCALLAAPAIAGPTVLGIQLGKPLDYPQCPLDPDAPPPMGRPCLQVISGFVLGQDLPPYAKSLHPVLDNGVVASIEIITNGAGAEAAAYKGLIQKFGPPTKHATNSLQNQFGAKFTDITATWKKPDVVVMFEGIAGGDPDNGFIDVATPAYAKQLIDSSQNKTIL